jgi:hypothetical protein
MKIIEQTDTELFIEIEDEILPITIDTGGRKLYVKRRSEKNESGGAMTTPQNQLYNLAEKIQRLSDMFEEDENGNDLFETIQQIELQMQDIMAAQQRQENLMNLIVQLLGKKGK